MSLHVIKRDVQAAMVYFAATDAGERYALGLSEIGASAFLTKFGPSHELAWAARDGFADGMRRVAEDNLFDVKFQLKLERAAR